MAVIDTSLVQTARFDADRKDRLEAATVSVYQTDYYLGCTDLNPKDLRTLWPESTMPPYADADFVDRAGGAKKQVTELVLRSQRQDGVDLQCYFIWSAWQINRRSPGVKEVKRLSSAATPVARGEDLDNLVHTLSWAWGCSGPIEMHRTRHEIANEPCVFAHVDRIQGLGHFIELVARMPHGDDGRCEAIRIFDEVRKQLSIEDNDVLRGTYAQEMERRRGGIRS